MRAVIAAFALLTRLPVWSGPVPEQDLGRAVAFFPAVGLVVGLVLTGLGYLVSGQMPSLLGAVPVLIALLALTGARHVPGLAAIFDGLGGGKGDRVETLAIMRDKRIGAYGATALVVTLTTKLLAIAVAVDRRDLVVLLVAPALARFAAVPVVALFTHARADGGARDFASQTRVFQLVVASLIVGGLAGALGVRVLVAAVITAAVTFALALWLRQHLRVLNEDADDAAIEAAETIALLSLSAWVP